MQKKSVPTFPKRFLWGASTSSHQVEGNTHNQWTVWELENAKALATKAEYVLKDLENWEQIKTEAKSPANYAAGDATDHYNRYEEDFQIIKQLNMNAYRYSIEWSRVEPEEGAWNAEAIEHYKIYTARLRALGIEPIVTLFHFTLPVWFAAKGGFEKRSNIKYFVRYAEKIMNELGPHVKIVVTLNEPTVYAVESYHEHHWPPALVHKKYKVWRVINNMARAHRQTAKMLHAMNRRYKVTIAHNSMYFYPGDNAWLSRVSAQIMQYMQDDYFLRKIIKHCDVLGVNFYFSNRVYGYRVHNPNERLSDVGWDLSPSHIQYVLERLYQKYKLPLIVTESGLADGDDSQRRWFITQQLVGMQKALDEGVDLRGYLHWSLLDNFEWAYGKWPRYGLVHVDYKTQQRTPRPSAIWFGKVIRSLRVADS
ncbi:MAG: putative beta-glucosidase [Candidatus Saccharibacteria bacterium]|nr:putative beta-glucosidase [Candidatus Saccharibacteria bacterium]